MAIDALNKLCKWRSVLAGWHRGTSSVMTGGKPTPGVAAMRDLMDKWLIMRAENSAIVRLLVEQKVFDERQFRQALMDEAAALDKDMERIFPGFRTSEDGIVIYDPALARKTTEEKGFPP
jgi:hypothetical protein